MAKKGSKKKISYHELSDEELNKHLGDLKKEQQDIRFQVVTSAVSNVRRLRHIRRDVARIHTVRRLREIAAAKQQPTESN